MAEKYYDIPYYDYYNGVPSYVKQIINVLPEGVVSNDVKEIIISIYNYMLNSASVAKKQEVVYVSSKFVEKMGLVPEEEILYQAGYIYNTFLKSMVHQMINRERIFNAMNECVKIYVGYYSEKEMLISTPTGIKREVGSYR